MKLYKLLKIPAFIAGLTLSSLAGDQRQLHVLPSHLDQDGGKKIAQTVFAVVDRAPSDTEFTFIEGGRKPRHLFNFTKSDYPNKRLERDAKRSFQVKINSYFATALEARANPSQVGCVNTPALASFMPEWIEDGENTRVLVFGSLNFAYDPALSFVDTEQEDITVRYRRPSFGHLTAAQRFQSPFAMPDNALDLSDVVIHWFDPYQDEFPQADHYYNEVTEFYAAFFSRYSARMIEVRSDTATFVADVFGKPGSFVPVTTRQQETTVGMLSISALEKNVLKDATEKKLAKEKAEAARLKARFKKVSGLNQVIDLETLSSVWIIDNSGSIANARGLISRTIAGSALAKNEQTAVVVYSTAGADPATQPAAKLCAVGSDPKKVAADYLRVPLKGGATELHAGLSLALKTLDGYQSTKVKTLKVITDEVPSDAAQCVALIKKLTASGCQLIVYRLGGCDTSWLPKEGVTIRDL